MILLYLQSNGGVEYSIIYIRTTIFSRINNQFRQINCFILICIILSNVYYPCMSSCTCITGMIIIAKYIGQNYKNQNICIRVHILICRFQIYRSFTKKKTAIWYQYNRVGIYCVSSLYIYEWYAPGSLEEFTSIGYVCVEKGRALLWQLKSGWVVSHYNY